MSCAGVAGFSHVAAYPLDQCPLDGNRQPVAALCAREVRCRENQAEAYSSQIESIEKRAELIRRCFLLALIALAGTICSCLLLGLGLYVRNAAMVAAVAVVASLVCLLLSTLYYIREVMVSLSSVHDEARDPLFMDLGSPPEAGGRDAL
ncbi:MAG: hypothetical protein DMG80_03545 [Acidobacteria bacterium]|nr:MAG: hypothetical protein DMG80_03545 [Acidobacteriota bacterium]